MTAQSPTAYAKLLGEGIEYFVHTLSLTLGRRVPGTSGCDVDLGQSRSISRVHARIDYDFDSRQFKICPLGKNGVSIDGTIFPPNHPPIPLKSK
jgi:hypothetical protein